MLSFRGVPRLPQLREPFRVSRLDIAVADLLELAGTKAMVVQKRAEAKDSLDLHALIHVAQIDLATILATGHFRYAPRFAPEQTSKALCYFEDGNLRTLPRGVRDDLMRAVRSTDPCQLPKL